MADQVKNGKAFEYAIAKVYHDAINSKGLLVELLEDDAFNNAKACFDDFEEKTQLRFLESANATVDTLFKIEPGLNAKGGKDTSLKIRIAKDGEGQDGDVRDVIFSREKPAWEIGFSAKNNNDAVKHSRLSSVLDFGKEWVGVNVSNRYWDDIKPVFTMIDKKIKENPQTKWEDLGNDKEQNVYIPLLEAFRKELLFINNNNEGIPQKLISYLIGKYPFYKIIKDDSHNLVIVKAFNIEGKLNQTVNKVKPRYKTQSINLPTRIVEFERHGSTNTLYMILDGGWEISFRIHNASSKLERSLKFDIRLLGNPPILFTQHLFQ
ncbi:MAG: HaeIII family restriction endonuclease [Prevotella sp.]|nr:HaeIII family restriction endonuclease [Prevotella sp.]MBR6138513.1 HaeIII family restriction endonuclease [Prevotella sp.]